jgi:hypothetical protein
MECLAYFAPKLGSTDFQKSHCTTEHRDGRSFTHFATTPDLKIYDDPITTRFTSVSSNSDTIPHEENATIKHKLTLLSRPQTKTELGWDLAGWSELCAGVPKVAGASTQHRTGSRLFFVGCW